MLEDVQDFILKGLLENKTYFRNVIKNIKSNHFDEGRSDLIDIVYSHFKKYDNIPTYDIIKTHLKKQKGVISDERLKVIIRSLKKAKSLDLNDYDWLLDETKLYVRNKSVEDLLQDGATYLYSEETKNKISLEGIHNKMQDIVSLSWDEDLGIEFNDMLQFDEVYDKLETITKRVPTGIRALDDAIGGGIETNTSALYVFTGSAGGGKSLTLSNIAVNGIKSGYNVIYLSFELVEQQLRKRIDSTFSEMDISNIISNRSKLKEKIQNIHSNNKIGRLFIKEYPTGSCSVIDIENYISKLKLQKDFIPDIVVVDYLGIMRPLDLKTNSNSYEKTKIVCEELRSLSGKYKVPFISAAQLNRGGTGVEKVGLDNIADSMGIAHTSDLVVALTTTDELKEDDKIRFEVLKSRISRDGDIGYFQINYKNLKIENPDSPIDQEDKLKEVLNKHKQKKIKNSGGSIK